MPTLRLTQSLPALAVIALLTLPQGAMAQAIEAKDFGARFAAVYASMGYPLKIASATAAGDTVTLSGVRMEAIGGTDMSADLGTLTFTGVTGDGNGGYRAAEVTEADTSFDVMGYTVTLRNLKASDLYLPATLGPIDALQQLGSMSVGPIEVTHNGNTLITIASISSRTVFTPSQGAPDLEALDIGIDLTGFSLDATAIEDKEAAAGVALLGSPLTGSAREHVTWTLGDGRIAGDELSITLDNLGKLAMTIDMSGYTPAYLASMQQMQAQLAQIQGATPNPEQASAQQMAMAMSALQSLTFNSMSLRFDDASLTNKLLDVFAIQAGQTRAQYIAGLLSGLPEMMEALDGTGLGPQVTAAVTTFLNDPRSIEVAVAPSAPLPFAMLLAGPMMASGGGDPTALLGMFGLSITANQP